MNAPLRVPTSTRTPLIGAAPSHEGHRVRRNGLRQVGWNPVELVESMVMPQAHRFALHFEIPPVLHGGPPQRAVRSNGGRAFARVRGSDGVARLGELGDQLLEGFADPPQ